MMQHNRQWYAVHTKPRQEALAGENLQRQAFEIYLPQLEHARRCRGRWRPAIEPLFPRYLFIRLDLGQDNTAPIRSTRGVSRLVSFNGQPAPVPDPFIDALRDSADAATGLHRPAASLFQHGSAVTIVSGPLAGLEAVFKTHDGETRSIILLDMLGKTQQLVINKDHLWPAKFA